MRRAGEGPVGEDEAEVRFEVVDEGAALGAEDLGGGAAAVEAEDAGGVEGWVRRGSPRGGHGGWWGVHSRLGSC